MKMPASIIAHRGASFLAPENTLSALKKAWSLGVSCSEIDVRLTADQQIILMHDEDTFRSTGVSKVVAGSTYDELRSLSAGRLKPGFPNEPVPLLSEAFQTVPPSRRLLVEIKSGVEIIDPFLKLIHQPSFDRGSIEVISFSREVLTELKKRCDWLSIMEVVDAEAYSGVSDLVQRLEGTGLQGATVEHVLCTPELLKTFRQKKLRCLVWTVNELDRIQYFLKMGVDGVTTDKPELLLNSSSLS